MYRPPCCLKCCLKQRRSPLQQRRALARSAIFAQWMNAARLQQSSEMLQKMPGSPIQAGAVAPPSDTALLGALQSQEQEIKKRFRSDTLSAAQDPAAALKVQGEVA